MDMILPKCNAALACMSAIMCLDDSATFSFSKRLRKQCSANCSLDLVTYKHCFII